MGSCGVNMPEDVFSVLFKVATIAQHLPIEKWLVRRDPEKEMEKLEALASEIALTRMQAPPIRQVATVPQVSTIPQLPVGRTITPIGAIAMPTTEETVAELKRRLAKEIYAFEKDLLAGGRIAGKPCDCLGENIPLASSLCPKSLCLMNETQSIKISSIG